MKELIIIGASGHGRVVADIAREAGYTSIQFLDDDSTLTVCGEYSVVGNCDRMTVFDCDFIVAIGNAAIRRMMQERLERNGKVLATLIHPSAVVAKDVRLGTGTVVMAGVVINPGVVIGKGCIINTCSSVDHDCLVGDYVHISVGAHLAGTVHIGMETWIGAGATVSNNISIIEKCVVGAGAVVVRDIKEQGTYIGVPAVKK